MFALLALALVLAPFHAHESADHALADRGSIVFTLDANGPSPEPQPHNLDHKSGSCGVCSVTNHAVPAQIVDTSVVPIAGELKFLPVPPAGGVAAAPTDLFRPPIRSAA